MFDADGSDEQPVRVDVDVAELGIGPIAVPTPLRLAGTLMMNWMQTVTRSRSG